MKRFLLVFTALILVLTAFGQDHKLNITGKVSDQKTKKRLGGSTIKVLDGGTVVKSVQASGSGTFSILLPLNKKYRIEVSKPGKVTKFFNVDVSGIYEEDLPPGNLPLQVDMTLFDDSPNVDFSFLKSEAVVDFFYDDMQASMGFNKGKLNKMKKKIDKLLAEAEAAGDKEDTKRKDFEKLMAEGESLYSKSNYEGALQKYEAAKNLIPDDPLVKARIKEVQDKLKNQQQEAEYNKLITQADNAFGNKSYKDALGKYNQALNIKPNESHPTNRIIEIEGILEKLKKEEEDKAKREEQYKNLITAADNLASQKDYSKAISKYEEALTIKPDEAYPKGKVSELKSLLKKLEDEKKKEEEYNALISSADAAFTSKDYAKSKSDYEAALKIKPAEAHPSNRIKEIEKILADEAKAKELEEKYAKLIQEGDAAFGSKSWDDAKAKYEQALQLKAGEGYPTAQLQKIKEEKEKAAAEAALEAEYNKLIAEAKQKFDAKDYEGAKAKYKEALTKKDQDFPKEQIKIINGLIQKLKEEEENQAAYDKLMQEGESLMAAKEYEEAKQKFSNALLRKPQEALPKQKMDEIDALLKKLEEEKKLAAIEEQYNNYMKLGNEKMTEKDYQTAIERFKNALEVKPNDSEALAKIDEANKKIKEAEELAKKEAEEKAYNELIQKGEELIGKESWTDAKLKFQDALNMRPTESLPKEKIAFIEKKIAEMDATEAKEKEYKSLIDAADNYYNQGKWSEAKSKYQAALVVKPDESKPKERIAEIDKKLEELAKNNAKLAAYQEKLKLADDAFNAGKYAESIPLYKAAKEVDETQVYPDSQITKAEEKIKELAAQKELAAYQKVIDQADALRDQQKYKEAIDKYGAASSMQPGEAYPKQQIEFLNDLIKKQEEALKNKEQAEKDYQAYLAKGQEELSKENYQAAIDAYRNASAIKPAETLPKKKIDEINALIAKANGAKQMEAQYNEHIKQGDNLMASSSYEAAIEAYKSALGIKPGESYPTEQIKKAEGYLSQVSAIKDDKDYQRYMKEGIKYLARDEMLDAAEDYFKRALKEKPGDTEALAKIEEVKQRRDNLAQAEQDAVDKEAKYNKLINAADNLFEQSKWNEAQIKYTEARNVFDRAYPKEQIEKCKNKLIKNDGELIKKIAKVIKVADKKFAAADYEKAKELYTRAIGLNKNINRTDQYPIDQLEKIKDILFEKDKTNVAVEEYGELVTISVEEMNRKFEESITNSDFKDVKEIDDVKVKYDDEENQLRKDQYKEIGKLELDLQEYKKDSELLTIKMDDNRKDNEILVDKFNDQVAINNDEMAKYEWMEVERVRADVDLMYKNDAEQRVEMDKNRIDMERKVVDYNVELNKKSIERNANVEVEIDNLRGNIENKMMEMEVAFNGMDNMRDETAKNAEILVDNLEVHNFKEYSKDEDGIHLVKDDVAEMKKDIEQSFDEADENRKKTTKDVETYSDQLEIVDQKRADEYTDRIVDTKEDADLLVYKRDENVAQFDKERIKNEKKIENFEDRIEKNKVEIEKEDTKKADEAKALADKLMEIRNGQFTEKMANDLADKFPQGMTEDIYQQKNSKGEIIGFVVRRIVVSGDRGDIYVMRKNRFGTSFTKNGAPTNQYVWDNESFR